MIPKKYDFTTYAKNDIDWALRVKERDTMCCHCGSGWNLEAAHIVGRGHQKLRLLLVNGITLCWKHHRWITDNPEQEERLMKRCLSNLYDAPEIFDKLEEMRYAA